MCHAQDLLDNKLLIKGKIVPVLLAANLKQTIEDTIHMHRMQADLVQIKIELKLISLRDIKVKFDAQRL